MITLEKLLSIAQRVLKTKYEIWVEEIDHQHMTMGRANDRQRKVTEYMLLARKL
jgi:adenine-specific DNA-methyltransferase